MGSGIGRVNVVGGGSGGSTDGAEQGDAPRVIVWEAEGCGRIVECVA